MFRNNKHPDFVISGLDKAIVYSIGGCFMLWLLGMSLYGALFGPTFQEQVRIDFSNEIFEGRVDTIYHEGQNRNALVAILSNQQKYYITPEWETLISIDDSLQKKYNSFILEVYSKDGKVKKLDFREVSKPEFYR
ncbi:hypothetical protein [Pedobacter frigoris]|uniref:hypothetical protein n=1 Tax=Pedobacter frigoris TaxID=2571272 RepID=UPI002930B14D|nr:hypothetical protein [Pedobacter frigoris]